MNFEERLKVVLQRHEPNNYAALEMAYEIVNLEQEVEDLKREVEVAEGRLSS